MGRRFWAWIALGTVLVALGSASLGFAFANRSYSKFDPAAGWTNYVPLDVEGSAIGLSLDTRADAPCFECVNPIPWYALAGALVIVGVVPFLVAARPRRPLGGDGDVSCQ